MKALKTSEEVASSFRDPSGFLFWRHGSLYRQVNLSYKEDYEHLMTSGLCDALVADGLLVAHEEVSDALAKRSADVLRLSVPNSQYRIRKTKLSCIC